MLFLMLVVLVRVMGLLKVDKLTYLSFVNYQQSRFRSIVCKAMLEMMTAYVRWYSQFIFVTLSIKTL